MVFISVHVDSALKSAGFHKSEQKYKRTLIESCEAARRVLNDGGSALDAVVKAIEILENDGITNCGRGSALNLNCEVQCDASLMQSVDLNWAGVGSVSGLQNPILAAKCMLLNQQKKHPDNLINPCFLSGDGARKWSIEHGCLESDDLITDQAMDLFEKHRLEITKLKEDAICSTINEQFKSVKKRKRDDSTSSFGDFVLTDHGYSSKTKILDTVGAIAIDDSMNVASAVSSGGIMFKDEGRIGVCVSEGHSKNSQAAVYTAGCWAEDDVAVTTTGVGEYLIETYFAKKCANKLLKASRKMSAELFDKFAFDEVLRQTFVDNFLNSKYLNTTDHDKLIGVLSLVNNSSDKKAHLIWAHNTPSMFLAYATGEHETELIFSKSSEPISRHNLVARSLLINYN